MAQRRPPTQYQQIEAQKPYMGEYSALAEQFLRKKDKPIYSVGQGLVEAGSDIAEAFLMKDAMQREKRKEDKDISDVAMAQRFAMDQGLARDPNSGALYSAEDFGGLQTQGIDPMSAQQRAAAATNRLAEVNPKAAVATAPGIMDIAKQFEAPKDTYQVNDKFGVMRTPAGGGAPEVVTPLPAQPRPSKLLTAEEEAQQLRIEAAKRTPRAAMTPVEMYQKTFGPLEAGMTPEIIDGKMTSRQVPIPNTSKDPAVIEQKRIKDLEISLPKASAAVQSSLGEFDKTISAIDEVLDPKNAGGLASVTGFGGTSMGKMLTIPGGDASRVQARLDQIRGRTFIAGMNMLKAASPTGATGLGAASEREGENVIQAQAALNQAQNEEDYAIALKEYKAALMQAKNTIADTFQQEFAPVLPKVEAPATRGVSGSWGDGGTKVIAGARVTRLD